MIEVLRTNNNSVISQAFRFGFTGEVAGRNWGFSGLTPRLFDPDTVELVESVWDFDPRNAAHATNVRTADHFIALVEKANAENGLIRWGCHLREMEIIPRLHEDELWYDDPREILRAFVAGRDAARKAKARALPQNLPGSDQAGYDVHSVITQHTGKFAHKWVGVGFNSRTWVTELRLPASTDQKVTAAGLTADVASCWNLPRLVAVKYVTMGGGNWMVPVMVAELIEPGTKINARDCAFIGVFGWGDRSRKSSNQYSAKNAVRTIKLNSSTKGRHVFTVPSTEKFFTACAGGPTEVYQMLKEHRSWVSTRGGA